MQALTTGLFRVILWGALLLILAPVGWVVLTSFKPSEISQALPPIWDFTPTLKNYSDVLGGATYTSQHFGELLLHSVIVTVASTVLGLLVGIPAAYALARIKFPGKKSTATWILSTIMFPPAVSVVPIDSTLAASSRIASAADERSGCAFASSFRASG